MRCGVEVLLVRVDELFDRLGVLGAVETTDGEVGQLDVFDDAAGPHVVEGFYRVEDGLVVTPVDSSFLQCRDEGPGTFAVELLNDAVEAGRLNDVARVLR